MQFNAKLAFLLLSIQSVCSMENSHTVENSHTEEIIEAINSLDMNVDEKNEMIMQAMQTESMNSLSTEEKKRIELVQKNQEKERIEFERSSQQCLKNVQVVADACFCGLRQGIKVDEIEEWCKTGQYCFVDDYTSASCHWHKHCAKSSREEAEKNGDLFIPCLCGPMHTECKTGHYCSKNGRCLSKYEKECETNKKLFDRCVCGRNSCEQGSVCVRKEEMPQPTATDQCIQLCDRKAIYSDNGDDRTQDDSECICHARNPLEIKFCKNTQTCKAVANEPTCVDKELDMDDEDTDDWWREENEYDLY